MQILSKNQVLEACKRAFKDNTITMTAETHPQEFLAFLSVAQNQGKWWMPEQGELK